MKTKQKIDSDLIAVGGCPTFIFGVIASSHRSEVVLHATQLGNRAYQEKHETAEAKTKQS